jgi:putative ABC transport system substrate-binding protein
MIAGAAAWPLAARAQQRERMRRIGVLMTTAADDLEGQARIAAFLQGLQQWGWTVGGNVRIDIRFAADNAATRKHASELASLAPDVILANSSAAVGSLLQATRTVPIVFAVVADPVGSGFVASFPQPGGNVTGFVTMEPTMAGKWLELLQGDCAARRQGSLPVQPGNGDIFRILAEPLQSRRCLLRSGGDRSTCSRQVRTRIRHCRTGTRAEWRRTFLARISGITVLSESASSPR